LIGTCEACGQPKENVHTNRRTGRDTCGECNYRDVDEHEKCSKCKEVRYIVAGKKSGKPLCMKCYQQEYNGTLEVPGANGFPKTLEKKLGKGCEVELYLEEPGEVQYLRAFIETNGGLSIRDKGSEIKIRIEPNPDKGGFFVAVDGGSFNLNIVDGKPILQIFPGTNQ
jgi:hypothetical protein